MMLERLFGTGPAARLLPVERLHGPTVAVVAIMTFAMILVAAAGLALANASSAISSAAEHKFVVQLPSASDADMTRTVATLRSVEGVRAVEAISEQEMRETLEQWLGDAASSEDLPIPALATVELDPGADPAHLAGAVRTVQPGATVTSEGAELQPLLRTIQALQVVAVGLVLLMAAANGAAIVLAARGALDTHRSTVEIMHGIGATDRQVTRLFVRKIGIDAVAGSLAGAALAAVVLLVVGSRLAAAASGLGAGVSLGALGIVSLALIPPVAVLLVIGVARRTLLTSLRENL